MNLFPKILKSFFFCLIGLFLFTVNVMGTQPVKNTPMQTWKGEITGMVIGEWTANILKVKNSQSELTVESRVKMALKNVAGYGGASLKGRIKGKIKDGLFQADFSGSASHSEGQSMVSGSFIGTLSETQGFGSYRLNGDGEQFNGEWTLQKQ